MRREGPRRVSFLMCPFCVRALMPIGPTGHLAAARPGARDGLNLQTAGTGYFERRTVDDVAA